MIISVESDGVRGEFDNHGFRGVVYVGLWGGRRVGELFVFDSYNVAFPTGDLDFRITDLTGDSLFIRHFV